MNRSLFTGIAVLFLAGCVGSGRDVVSCEWPSRSRGAEATLVADVRLAEDVAIRFADAQGYREGWRATRESCEAALFAAIAATRGIGDEEIAAARASLDTRPFDWLVNVPMAGGWFVLAWPATRRLRLRFRGEPIALAVSMLCVSVAIAVTIVAAGQLWAGYVEMLRIGNGHLSYRAQRIPWSHHRVETFVMVIVGVWLLGALGHPRSPNERSSPCAPPMV